METFKIMDGIKLHLPGPTCRPSQPLEDYVVVFLDAFDAVLWLPLCEFYRRMLHALNVALF